MQNRIFRPFCSSRRDREDLSEKDRSRSHDLEYKSKDERRSHKDGQRPSPLTPQRPGASQNSSRHDYNAGDSRTTLSPHGRNHRDRERDRDRDRERDRDRDRDRDRERYVKELLRA